MSKVLACVFQASDSATDPEFSAGSILRSVSSKPREGFESKILVNPELSELETALGEFKPTVLFMGGPPSFEQSTTTGALQACTFKGGEPGDVVLGELLNGKGVQLLYFDAKCDESKAKSLQSSGTVPNVITWGKSGAIPATVAAQFCHSFFSILSTYASASPQEAFAFSTHVAEAYFTTKSDDKYSSPELPKLMSAQPPALPDNSSIPPIGVIDGADLSQGIAKVPGWSDIRLLAPRAELRLLLCGSSSLIDSTKLSFLGEAIRALLVFEMRSVKLLATTPSSKLPANLPEGCNAVRCELRTASGRVATVVLGGKPDVLKENKLVEYALRMTTVSDSLSLQFRLPPPGVDIPVPRCSPVIAGGAQVVDTVCLTSVWAVQVLRSLSQDEHFKGILTLGVAAVGGSATIGVGALEVLHLGMLTSGQHPACKATNPSAGAKELKQEGDEEDADEGAEAGEQAVKSEKSEKDKEAEAEVHADADGDAMAEEKVTGASVGLQPEACAVVEEAAVAGGVGGGSGSSDAVAQDTLPPAGPPADVGSMEVDEAGDAPSIEVPEDEAATVAGMAFAAAACSHELSRERCDGSRIDGNRKRRGLAASDHDGSKRLQVEGMHTSGASAPMDGREE